MSTHSLDAIVGRLDEVAPRLAALGAMSRILACAGIWQQFDKLRQADAPFDRARFVHYLGQSAAWAETCPDRGQAANGSESSLRSPSPDRDAATLPLTIISIFRIGRWKTAVATP